MNYLPNNSENLVSAVRSVYNGIPKKKGEINNWNKFLSWLVPWLNQKRLLGEAYLEAEVELQQAQVRDLEAAAALKLAQADREHAEAMLSLSKAQEVVAETAEIYCKLEQQKNNSFSSSKNDIDKTAFWKERLDILEDKIHKLNIEYGGSLKVFPPKSSKQADEEIDIPTFLRKQLL